MANDLLDFFCIERIDRFGEKYKLKVFTSYFGTTPQGAREIAQQLLDHGKVDDGELTTLSLFMALNLLRNYNPLDVHAGIFQVNWKKTKNAWVVIKKISELMPNHLEWPWENDFDFSEDEDEDEDDDDDSDSEDEDDIEDEYRFVAYEDEYEDLEEDEDGEEYEDDEVPELVSRKTGQNTRNKIDEDEDEDQDEDYVLVEAEDIKDTFILSVDGVHCRINEPMHPKYRKNPKQYSHKFRSAGYVYEVCLSIFIEYWFGSLPLTQLLFSQIALHLFTSKVAWVNGPFPASFNDKTIAKTQGFGHRVPDGKLVIGDKGYTALDFVSTRNSLDCPAVKTFKKRALARHETFNKRLKDFYCLANRFRHGKEKFKFAFEACVVITQINMDLGAPLFDTLCAACDPLAED